MPFRIKKASAMLLTILLAMLFACAAAEDKDNSYVENEWNFVDASMDISNGIPDTANGVLARIREKGVLRVATEVYFAPQEFIDPEREGQDAYAGADMELARRIAERMGVELVIVPMEFTEVLRAVAADECDLAIAALDYTPKRAVTNELSKGYYFTETLSNITLVIRAEDAEKYRSTDDLADAVLTAQRGTRLEAVTVQNVIRYMEFRRLPQIQDVYDSVISGAADAGVVELENALNYLRNNPDCGLVIAEEVRFALEDQYTGDRVAGKKGETELMYFVNGVIDEVISTGLYGEWYADAEKRANELDL